MTTEDFIAKAKQIHGDTYKNQPGKPTTSVVG